MKDGSPPPETDPADNRKRRPKPLTKTRLRRGEIARKEGFFARHAEFIDFLSTAHGDAEDFLCDLAGEEFTVQGNLSGRANDPDRDRGERQEARGQRRPGRKR